MVDRPSTVKYCVALPPRFQAHSGRRLLPMMNWRALASSAALSAMGLVTRNPRPAAKRNTVFLAASYLMLAVVQNEVMQIF